MRIQQVGAASTISPANRIVRGRGGNQFRQRGGHVLLI